MAAPEGFPWSFRDVCVSIDGYPYFVAGRDRSTNEGVPVTDLLFWNGDWTRVEVPFIATNACIASYSSGRVHVMGLRGNVFVWDGERGVEEIIDESDYGPQYYGDLTEIRVIDGRAYVVGMCRTAYRKDAPNSWTRIDESSRTAEDDESDAGFTSIDGFGSSEIYAVGWDGEIWNFDGYFWTKIDSPVNGILFRVVCGRNGVVYACGQKGILVEGRGDEWRVIEQEETRENLWGAVWFNESLYVSGSKNLYRLQSGALRKIELPLDGIIKSVGKNSFYRLDENGGSLWSAGRKMILSTCDGIKWNEPDYLSGPV